MSKKTNQNTEGSSLFESKNVADGAPSYEDRALKKTENFGTRNVKLITFLIVTGVFLVLFLPMAIFGIDMAIDWASRDERPQMKLEDVIRLSEEERELYLSDLEKYRGDLIEYDYETHYSIEIAPSYYLRAVAQKDTGKLIYFEMVNTDTKNKVNILTEDVRAYLNSN